MIYMALLCLYAGGAIGCATHLAEEFKPRPPWYGLVAGGILWPLWLGVMYWPHNDR